MIFGNINNINEFEGKLSDRLFAGLEFLRRDDLDALECETRHKILDDDVYAVIQERETRPVPPVSKFEAHRKFIDIQFVIKGVEKFGVCALKNCSNSTGYNKENDIEFFESYSDESYITGNEGDFIIFFPTDAHAPLLTVDKENSTVKKVVVKVAL